jgi:hypothetical protein
MARFGNANIMLLCTDITGKSLSAVDVFTLSMKALVDHLMKMLTKQGTNVLNDEVQWILTVPAIWTDLATGAMSVSNDFPQGLYLWHRCSRVIFIYLYIFVKIYLL